MNDRILVSRLIILVLTGQMPVRQALLNFPKDTNDTSIITAYHALIHYEADEDIRATDIAYKEEQDEYLEFIADTLSKNRTLPQNIIKSYKNYYSNVALPKDKSTRNIIKKICKFLNIK